MTDVACRVCGTPLGAGYLCDDCDSVVINRQHNPSEATDELTFYFGGASGSARKALRELQEPNVMLNYATKLNEPWWGIQRLFIDSGGYSFMSGTEDGEYTTTDAAYLDYVAEHEPELFALRDYPCERDLREKFGVTVAENQQRTVDRHRSLLDGCEGRSIKATPVCVLQGWTAEDYREHADMLREAGCLTEYVGIGTLCGRDSTAEIRRIVTAVRDELASRHKLHAFGVKLDAFREPEVIEAVDSADSNAFDFDERKERTRGGDTIGREWQDVALFYLQHRQKLRQRVGAGRASDPEWHRDERQSGLEELVAADGGFAEGEEGCSE